MSDAAAVRCGRWMILVTWCVYGCAGEPAKGGAAADRSPEKGTMDASRKAPQEGQVVRGRLQFRELPAVKSVQAYEGVEFSLQGEGGESLALTPAAVPRERLQALDGKQVELRVRRVEGAAPSPLEQAPLGPDGKPLRRPARHEVLEVVSER
ncbi:MAG: hypothetical protein MUF64_09965 [Polyangiaceae bacterium]|nr:hypothetical protein [Polyangiaceae bacterium]